MSLAITFPVLSTTLHVVSFTTKNLSSSSIVISLFFSVPFPNLVPSAKHNEYVLSSYTTLIISQKHTKYIIFLQTL